MRRILPLRLPTNPTILALPRCGVEPGSFFRRLSPWPWRCSSWSSRSSPNGCPPARQRGGGTAAFAHPGAGGAGARRRPHRAWRHGRRFAGRAPRGAGRGQRHGDQAHAQPARRRSAVSSSSSATRPPTQQQVGLGSGVIVSPEGYLLTNHHVVEDATEIEVQLADGRKTRARVVGSDVETDIAVLKIDLDNCRPSPWATCAHCRWVMRCWPSATPSTWARP
jgi:hypothetical protein